jgi:hypothetical protein
MYLNKGLGTEDSFLNMAGQAMYLFRPVRSSKLWKANPTMRLDPTP